jgi:hypothetical protein
MVTSGQTELGNLALYPDRFGEIECHHPPDELIELKKGHCCHGGII